MPDVARVRGPRRPPAARRFREKDDDDGDHNGWGNFRGEQRSNDTHESKTDPEAKLMRKGKGREAKLCFAGHALMDNRNGLLVDLRVSEANGYCERETALEMLAEHAKLAAHMVGAAYNLLRLSKLLRAAA